MSCLTYRPEDFLRRNAGEKGKVKVISKEEARLYPGKEDVGPLRKFLRAQVLGFWCCGFGGFLPTIPLNSSSCVAYGS